jgi:hypothetical protein
MHRCKPLVLIKLIQPKPKVLVLHWFSGNPFQAISVPVEDPIGNHINHMPILRDILPNLFRVERTVISQFPAAFI